MMIHCLGLALGGENMMPVHRDGLIRQILTALAPNRRMPLGALMHGLGGALGGRLMKPASLAAVLERFMDCRAGWNLFAMQMGISNLCQVLGGAAIAPDSRDRVTSAILASSATSSTHQMGSMLHGMCKALRNANPGAVPGAPNTTQDHLDAILRAVLIAHATGSAAKTAAMILSIAENMTPVQRATLRVRILESGHASEIIAVIKLTPNGRMVVDFLQLVERTQPGGPSFSRV